MNTPDSNNTVFSFGRSLMPQEEMLDIEKEKKQLKIAIAKESSLTENRVALAPHAVELLVANGHEVLVESGAGKRSNFTDLMYSELGGKIVKDSATIYQADIIVKVAPLTSEEIDLLKGKQILMSMFQIGTQNVEYLLKLQSKRITAIGYEYYSDANGETHPIMQSMSEISGTTSILIAAEYLSNAHNGKGEMLGGISGIAPTDIVILGSGTAGEYAARTAIGLGATVKVFDSSISKLRNLQEKLGNRIFTSILQPRILSKALKYADVVIGAIPIKDRCQFMVSEDAIKQMKPQSIIVDLSVEYGSCFETSKITCFKDPIFHKHGVIHYCVPNIPSRVARTATYALSNILGQILIEIGQGNGINKLLKYHPGLRESIYLLNGILTKENVGTKFGIPYQDINLLLAAF